jgi:hypothetical protein
MEVEPPRHRAKYCYFEMNHNTCRITESLHEGDPGLPLLLAKTTESCRKPFGNKERVESTSPTARGEIKART